MNLDLSRLTANTSTTSVKPTATVISGARAIDKMYLVTVELSSQGDGWEDSISEAMDNVVRTVDKTWFVDKQLSMGRVIATGHVVEAPKTISKKFYSDADAAEWLVDNGFSNLANNVFTDEDKKPWEISKAGGNTVIKRMVTDDLSTLLTASAEKYKAWTLADVDYRGTPQKARFNVDKLPGIIAYIDRDEKPKYGLAFSGVDGDPNRMQVISDETKSDVVIVSAYQAIAADYFHNVSDETYADMEPITYWSEFYKNSEKDIVEGLKILINQFNVDTKNPL